MTIKQKITSFVYGSVFLLSILGLSSSQAQPQVKEKMNAWIPEEFGTLHYKEIQKQCGEFIQQKKYSEIEAFFKKYDNDTLDANGHTPQTECLYGAANNTTAQEREAWLQASKNNIYPYIVAQSAAVAEFFKIRGNKYVSKTDPEQLQKANEVLSAGIDNFIKSKKLDTTPLWYVARLQAASFESSSFQFFKIVQEATRKYPNNPAVYRAAVANMSPEWGYPYEGVEAVAQLASENSRYKEAAYADIYIQYVNKHFAFHSPKLLATGAFQPELFSKGAQQILQKYPTNYTYNTLGLAACRLQQKALAKDLLENKIEVYASDFWKDTAYGRCSSFITN